MKNKIWIMVAILLIVIVGMWIYWKKQTEQKPMQSAQELRIQRDILEIRKFADSADLAVQFESDSKSSNGEIVPVNVYIAGANQYEIDTIGKIVEFRSRDLPVGSENEKVVDNTPRYFQQDLEKMARQLIAKNVAVNLDNLTPNHGIKGTNYFFKWEDRTRKTSEGYPFIQVGFSQGGSLLNYINAL